ncbi:hypothetical protein ACP4OV_027111 [Aristida adscensionis]
MSSEKKRYADEAVSPAAAEDEQVVMLRSCDGEEFAVGEAVARMSGMISNMIDDDCVEGGIQLPMVKGHVLARVLEYFNKKHATSVAAAAVNLDAAATIGSGDTAAAEFKKFEATFFEKLANKEALFDLILAANFLHAQDLLDAACQCSADQIRGKTVQEIRDYFGIVNDFTPEEAEEIRKENAWAFD